ncbi:ATP-dependent DNA helicase [Fuchsiella alkaliacetigena]|uniref:ATP-dependent DNA helicase n=1 Tax=Fuchsiella alkaliacetigena TaxID=957042 RepID=UPI00200B79B7|nr:ATP-dependent DNA helicase [Fuchsiella alkaliacetigena]MCK8825794.1 ATP-dependent helicase [Fuchsiella alkaliacetigena]
MEEIYKKLNFEPNDGQKRAIETTEGPLLIVAGPGSGKTQCLVLRAVNLLVNEEVPSEDILICTFTEKASLQLKTRIANIIDRLEANVDTSDIIINTIHGFCNDILREFNEYSNKISRGYEVLDELMQKFFVNDNFDQIIENSYDENREKKFLSKWKYKWQTIGSLLKYFNKLTQEMIEPEQLINSNDVFFRELGYAYFKYRELLEEKNYVDFAFQQYYVNELLENENTAQELKDRFKYIMVDEFQDTNYIQEKIIYDLIEKTENICVVGDEDQSLYRFRGATVRNLLEFPKNFPDCERVDLSINYRSHGYIIGFYSEFMTNIEWGKYRFDKYIFPCEENELPFYDSVFKIDGQNQADQAGKVAGFIEGLKEKEIINDYSEVAILLDSVKEKYSKPFMDALAKRDIASYCPRAKMFFKYDEIRYFIGAIMEVLDFDYNQVSFSKSWMSYLENIATDLEDLKENNQYSALFNWIEDKQNSYKEMVANSETSDENLLDLLYQMFQFSPFKEYLEEDGVEKYNLAKMSELLAKFNKFYLKGSSLITFKSINYLKRNLFSSFLYVIHKSGMNEFEDKEKIIQKGAVSIMTIHQSKGLEFPVVIVGNIGKRAMSSGRLDKELKEFKHRPSFEDYSKTTDFDYMRRYYVAFSRAEKFLVLTKYRKRANKRIRPSYKSIRSIEEVNKEEWLDVDIDHKKDPLVKKQFSLTSDILVYDTCPRQYELYKEVSFVSSRTGGNMFGSLVHNCIEDIHNCCLNGEEKILNEDKIEEFFEENYNNLREHLQHTLAPQTKESALRQVINYYKNNEDMINKIDEVELPITVEKPSYYINGKIDLILNEKGNYKLVDFKSQQKIESKKLLKKYKLQMATYSNLIQTKHGVDIKEAYIYWTGEDDPQKAKMPLEIESKDITKADNHFDNVVGKIINNNFNVKEKPSNKICKECDFRYNCD